MPRGSRVEESEDEPVAVEISWKPPKELVARLRPWLDLDEVGPDGFHQWLSSIVPLLPAGRSGPRTSGDATEGRIRELSQALTAAAGEAAQAHFQAATYFRENQTLARRVLALESILRTQGRPASRSPRAELAAQRYLPPE